MSAEALSTPMSTVTIEESRKATVNSNPLTTAIPSLDGCVGPNQYYEFRTRQVTDFKLTQNPNPYPHKFNASRSISEYINIYSPEEKIPAGTKLDGTIESLAGRIVGIRPVSSKLRFYDLQGEGKKVLIMVSAQHDPEDLNEFMASQTVFQWGDIVGVTGTPARTKKGELCILVSF